MWRFISCRFVRRRRLGGAGQEPPPARWPLSVAASLVPARRRNDAGGGAVAGSTLPDDQAIASGSAAGSRCRPSRASCSHTPDDRGRSCEGGSGAVAQQTLQTLSVVRPDTHPWPDREAACNNYRSYCSGPVKYQYPFGLSLSKPAPFDRLRANGLHISSGRSIKTAVYN